MRVTLNEVSSHLCKIKITLVTVKTHLQTGQRCYRIARRRAWQIRNR